MVAATLDTFLRLMFSALCEKFGSPLVMGTINIIRDVLLVRLDTTGKLGIQKRRLEEFLKTITVPVNNI